MSNVIKKARPSKNSSYWTYQFDKFPERTLHFNLGYLQRQFVDYCAISDKEFIQKLVQITHFATIVAYYKGLKAIDTISDIGIVHHLVHLMHHKEGGLTLGKPYAQYLTETRKEFARLLKI